MFFIKHIYFIKLTQLLNRFPYIHNAIHVGYKEAFQLIMLTENGYKTTTLNAIAMY